MAELVIPDGYGMAKLSWQMQGKPAPISITLGYSSLITPPVDCAEALYIFATYNGSIAAPESMALSYTFLGVEVHQNVDGVIEGASFGDPIVGTGGVIALPPINGTLLASKKTARVGRKFQGRMYLPNMIIPETDIDAMGNLDVYGQSVWPAMLNVFCVGHPEIDPESVGYLTATTPRGVILHSDATTPTPITSMIAKTQLATQRRRMR